MKKIVFTLLLGIALTACVDYGNKLEYGKGELYYTDKVSAAEAKKLGDFMKETAMFPEGKKVAYQIDRVNDTLVFKRVLNDEEYLKDQSYIESTQIVGGFLSLKVFDKKPVATWLTDNKFEPLKKIPFKALSDSLLKRAIEEDKMMGAPQSPDELPKDNVIPVDTSRGTPA